MRLKNTDETKNCLFEEINYDWMSKKAQKNYAVLIYVQHLHVLDSVVTR